MPSLVRFVAYAILLIESGIPLLCYTLAGFKLFRSNKEFNSGPFPKIALPYWLALLFLFVGFVLQVCGNCYYLSSIFVRLDIDLALLGADRMFLYTWGFSEY